MTGDRQGGRCLHCQAELPDTGRFCVMCGRRIGHSVRERSGDHRVYTSPLGHAVPKELAVALKAEEDAERAHDSQPLEPSPIPPHGPLYDVLHTVLWAMLLCTLAGGAAFGVYLALQKTVPEKPAPVLVAAPRPVTGSKRPRPQPPRPPATPDLVIPTTPAAPAAGNPAPAAQPAAPTPAALAKPSEGLSDSDIDFVASTHSPQVRACYDRAFRHSGEQAPAGRVELSFTVVDAGDAGRAVDIVTELNLLGDKSVSACLEERLAEWRFPRPPPLPPGYDKPPRRLRFPFVFTPAPF